MIGLVIDGKVQKFSTAFFRQGTHISDRIASTIVNVLLSTSADLSLKKSKQHQFGDVVPFKYLDFQGELQQRKKWKSLKDQEKKQGSSIIFELLTL